MASSSPAALQPRIAPRREPRPACDHSPLTLAEEQLLAKFRQYLALRTKGQGLWLDLAVDIDQDGKVTVQGSAGDGRRRR